MNTNRFGQTAVGLVASWSGPSDVRVELRASAETLLELGVVAWRVWSEERWTRLEGVDTGGNIVGTLDGEGVKGPIPRETILAAFVRDRDVAPPS